MQCTKWLKTASDEPTNIQSYVTDSKWVQVKEFIRPSLKSDETGVKNNNYGMHDIIQGDPYVMSRDN